MNYKVNKHFIHIIYQIHSIIDNNDIQKRRASEKRIGNLLSHNKNYIFSECRMNNLHAEWTKYINGNHDETIIFYCHGGGYMTGSSIYSRGITTKLAKYTKHDVFTFDYSLAPEFPFPQAITDAFTAWNTILNQGYKPQNIIIAGDSAGGNMALVLTTLLIEKKLALPKCLILFSPWTDMTTSGESYKSKALVDPILSINYINNAISNYLQGQSNSCIYTSPLFTDFHGFPPVYIQVGENEILLSDSINLYNCLLKCGVTAKIDIFPFMWHVFQITPLKTAREAIVKVADFTNYLL